MWDMNFERLDTLLEELQSTKTAPQRRPRRRPIRLKAK
jgi:hypothetical protein